MSYRFQGQQPNEDVVLFTRQHPFVLLHPFLWVALIMLLPLVVYIFTGSNTVLGLVLLGCLILACWRGILAWYSWNNSIFLITTHRVVLLEQRGLLHREFSESGLSTIQQVSHEIKGLLHTVFGYGGIVIYTGNSQAPFSIPNIPDPYEIQQEIQRAATAPLEE